MCAERALQARHVERRYAPWPLAASLLDASADVQHRRFALAHRRVQLVHRLRGAHHRPVGAVDLAVVHLQLFAQAAELGEQLGLKRVARARADVDHPGEHVDERTRACALDVLERSHGAVFCATGEGQTRQLAERLELVRQKGRAELLGRQRRAQLFDDRHAGFVRALSG